MVRKCENCDWTYDDEFRSTICPHDLFPANDGQNNFTIHYDSKIVCSHGLTRTDWLDMDLVPKNGTPILIDFGNIGIHRVFWEDDIWCVTDNKYDSRPLRGFQWEDIKGWMPLPESKA